MAVAALVLGIIGLVFGLIPFFGWFMFPIWILAIIFGAIGLKKEQGKGMSLAGLIMGSSALLLNLFFLFFLFLVGISGA